MPLSCMNSLLLVSRLQIYAELFSNLGSINWVSVSISLTSIAILVLIKELINPRVKKKLKVPVPGELVVVRERGEGEGYLDFLSLGTMERKAEILTQYSASSFYLLFLLMH